MRKVASMGGGEMALLIRAGRAFGFIGVLATPPMGGGFVGNIQDQRGGLGQELLRQRVSTLALSGLEVSRLEASRLEASRLAAIQQSNLQSSDDDSVESAQDITHEISPRTQRAPRGLLSAIFDEPSSYSGRTGSRGHRLLCGVRFSYINGIFNLPTTCEHAAQVVSRVHGDLRVNYVYHVSRGLWPDVRSAARHILTGSSVDGQSSAELLSYIWQELYREMSKESDCPHIIHYAHSYGAWLSYRAALMVPDIVPYLDLRLFGSPRIIPPAVGKARFKSVRHIVTSQDPITWLTYLQFYRRLGTAGLTNAQVALSSGEEFTWRQRHHLLGPIYGRVIERMGSDFQRDMARSAGASRWRSELPPE